MKGTRRVALTALAALAAATLGCLGAAGGCSSFGSSTEDPRLDASDAGVDASDAGLVEGAADAAQDADGAETGPLVRSCVGLAATCGNGSKDCCASNVVTGTAPAGTPFYRSNDTTYPATVSDFNLDVYEVTVGRFRSFVNAGKGKGTQDDPPALGEGAHPKIASSGWDPSFNGNLTGATYELKVALKCNATYPAWTDAPNGNETRPMNCVTWFEAFAFCAWDGGRLPTEAEWNYAAAGGVEQRDYPWGAGIIDMSKASYDCAGDGSDAGACAFSDLLPVGSKSPQGDGKWGQADLAGSVWEWSLDWFASPYRLSSCDNCADLQDASSRVNRGGSFVDLSSSLLSSVRNYNAPSARYHNVGVRCARAPAP